MKQFRYRARTLDGRILRGILAAPDRGTALSDLQKRTLFVTSVEARRTWTTELSLPQLGGSSSRHVVSFFRSFATLIAAGVPIQRGLRVAIESHKNDALSVALRAVLSDIERGDALSTALSRRKTVFAPLIVAMIAAGEAGGILDEVLDRIATFLERDHALRKSVTSALAYPAIVMLASFALIVFLIARIVPMFSAMFDAFRVELPASTRVLLWLGDALRTPGPWIIALLTSALVGVAFLRMRQTQRGRMRMDAWRLGIPVAGSLLRGTIQARLARMLGTLFRSGVELTRALEVVIPVTASPLYADALANISVALREGEALTPRLAASRLFDPMLVALVGVGEETGLLDTMFEKAAEYFEGDVAATISTIGAVVEPILIIALGILVGFLVYSVFVPLYSLIGSISK